MNTDTRDFLATLLFLADDADHDPKRLLMNKTIHDFATEFAEAVERFINDFRAHLAATGFDMSALDGMERSFGGNVYLSLSGHGAGFFDDANQRIAGLQKTIQEWAGGLRFSELEYSLDVRPDGKIDLSVLPNFKQWAYKNTFGLPGEDEKAEEPSEKPSYDDLLNLLLSCPDLPDDWDEYNPDAVLAFEKAFTCFKNRAEEVIKKARGL